MYLKILFRISKLAHVVVDMTVGDILIFNFFAIWHYYDANSMMSRNFIPIQYMYAH